MNNTLTININNNKYTLALSSDDVVTLLFGSNIVNDWFGYTFTQLKEIIFEIFNNPIYIPVTYDKIIKVQTDTKINCILLMGQKNVGKDTVGEYIANKLSKDSDNLWITYAMATPLKDIVKKLFGLSHDEVYDTKLKEIPLTKWNNLTPRKIMQTVYFILKDVLASKIPEIGFNFFPMYMEKIIFKNNSTPNVIITDGRAPQFAYYLKNKYITKIIKITRPNLLTDNDSSETDVNLFEHYDYLLENNDTIEDLYKKTDDIINQIKLKF